MRTSLCLPALIACTLAWPAFAAVTVGVGSSVDLADATMDWGCAAVSISGQLTATSAALNGLSDISISAGANVALGSGQVTLGGNFSNAGTFTPGTGRIGIVDACGTGTSQLSGSTSFYDFAVNSATGKQLVLPASVTQTVTHGLTLQGAAGNLLQLVSSSAGQHAALAVSPGASQTVSYVNARDNDASAATIAPGPASLYHSIDGGNLINWFLAAVPNPGATAIPAPILTSPGRIGMLIGILCAAWGALRIRGRKRKAAATFKRPHF
jgi:hypothetical protein